MYELRIYKHARREIKKMPRRYQNALLDGLNEIRENPFSGKPLVRKLVGKYSYRIGIYRIIYKVNKKDKIISVLTAGHRSGVYQ